MRFALAVVLLAAVACTDEEPTADPYKCLAAGGAGCFQLPSDPLSAIDPKNGFPVAPSLGCAPFQVVTSPSPVTLNGTTTNPLDETIVPAVRVELFADLTMSRPLGDVTSDDAGEFSVTIDAAPNVAFARSSADGNLPFFIVHQRVDISIPQHDNVPFESAPRMAIAAFFERVGDRFLPNKSQLTGLALDCDGNHLINAIINIAPSSGASGSRLFEDGVRTYYTIAGNGHQLGRRTDQFQTTQTAGFAASNLSAGHHFVQLWGFPTDGDLLRGNVGLEMLAELEIIVPSFETGIVIPMYGRL